MTPAAAAAHFYEKNKKQNFHSRVPTQCYKYKIKNKIKCNYLSMG